jgi:hypothetical protein
LGSAIRDSGEEGGDVDEALRGVPYTSLLYVNLQRSAQLSVEGVPGHGATVDFVDFGVGPPSDDFGVIRAASDSCNVLGVFFLPATRFTSMSSSGHVPSTGRAASNRCNVLGVFFLPATRFTSMSSFSDGALQTNRSGKRSAFSGLFFALARLASGCSVTRLGLRFGKEPIPVSKHGMDAERDFSKLPICLR